MLRVLLKIAAFFREQCSLGLFFLLLLVYIALYCRYQISVFLDLCKLLSFYIYFTLFPRRFLCDHCFCLLGILVLVRRLHLIYQLYVEVVAHSLPV